LYTGCTGIKALYYTRTPTKRVFNNDSVKEKERENRTSSPRDHFLLLHSWANNTSAIIGKEWNKINAETVLKTETTGCKIN
jgi:hypothetical protein